MSTIPCSVQAITVTSREDTTCLVAGEVAEYQYDATNDLGAGQVPVNPVVALVDVRTGVTVTNGATLDTVPVVGNVLFIRVANVLKGGRYQLRIQFDHSSPRVTGERTIRLHTVEGV